MLSCHIHQSPRLSLPTSLEQWSLGLRKLLVEVTVKSWNLTQCRRGLWQMFTFHKIEIPHLGCQISSNPYAISSLLGNHAVYFWASFPNSLILVQAWFILKLTNVIIFSLLKTFCYLEKTWQSAQHGEINVAMMSRRTLTKTETATARQHPTAAKAIGIITAFNIIATIT